MNSFLIYLGTSICLLLIIEGLLYSIFTETMRKFMAIALSMPEAKLRGYGMLVAALGFIILGFLLSVAMPK